MWALDSCRSSLTLKYQLRLNVPCNLKHPEQSIIHRFVTLDKTLHAISVSKNEISHSFPATLDKASTYKTCLIEKERAWQEYTSIIDSIVYASNSKMDKATKSRVIRKILAHFKSNYSSYHSNFTLIRTLIVATMVTSRTY